MYKFLLSFVILSAVFLSLNANVHAYSSPGSPSGYVNDFANIISDEVQVSLENQLEIFSASTSIEVAVVTVSSLGGDSVENYANELFREWGIGKQESNNGVLFLVALGDRKTRIEVGYGLEGIMPDIQAGYIVDNIIIPEFKKENYEGGIIQGTDAILKIVEGERFEIGTKSYSSDSIAVAFFVLFYLLIFSVQLIVSLLASTKSWWFGGIFGAAIGLLFSYSLEMSKYYLLPAIILGLSGLLFDYFISKSYKKYKKRGGKKSAWAWGGSKISRGGSGGFGGGGFGGGSSGGGGASGSW